MTKIKQVEQAIANLRAAISELTLDGASEQDLAPYRSNLRLEQERLRKLKLRSSN